MIVDIKPSAEAVSRLQSCARQALDDAKAGIVSEDTALYLAQLALTASKDMISLPPESVR